ncbi:CBO0543 family protein [Lysinibacillus irui]|uniref:CBO0543 family protein n=1 Tax=Lysinibacillus irui TaxID=2998077 RepID=UPI003D2BBD11
MFFNFLIAFVLPWLIASMHLFKKDSLLIVLIAPFSSVLAYFINTMAYYFGFWEVAPFPEQKNLASLPSELGIYPVLACYLVFLIRKFKRTYMVVVIMTVITTCLEQIFVLFGWIIYENGWNIVYTFFSYLLPYLVVYCYYRYLTKLSMFE